MLNGIKSFFSKNKASNNKAVAKNKKNSEAFYLFEYDPIIESRIEKSVGYGNGEVKAPMAINGGKDLDVDLIFEDSGKPNKEKCYAIGCSNCRSEVYKIEGIERNNEIILEAIKRHTEGEKKGN